MNYVLLHLCMLLTSTLNGPIFTPMGFQKKFVLAPPDSLNIHAMFLDGELQYRKSPQTVPVQFNPEAMTLTGGQEY